MAVNRLWMDVTMGLSIDFNPGRLDLVSLGSTYCSRCSCYISVTDNSVTPGASALAFLLSLRGGLIAMLCLSFSFYHPHAYAQTPITTSSSKIAPNHERNLVHEQSLRENQAYSLSQQYTTSGASQSSKKEGQDRNIPPTIPSKVNKHEKRLKEILARITNTDTEVQ